MDTGRGIPGKHAGYPDRMTDHSLEDVLSWRGRTVHDRTGEKLGKVGELYLDGATDLPAYASVRTGLLGRREAIVPLAGMEERDGELHLPYDAERVRSAPSLDPDAALDPDEEHALHEHYGHPVAEAPGTMVRSEEELSVGMGEMAPAERVRLRKVLVTEQVEMTVPRRREVIQLESDAPPAGTIESVEDLGEAPPGG